jgi:hypothetical protein
MIRKIVLREAAHAIVPSAGPTIPRAAVRRLSCEGAAF